MAADRNIWNWRWNNIAGLSANHFVIVTAGSFSEDESLFLHGSVILWVTVFVVGGFVEEYWRAFCVVALQQNGYTGIMANLLSAFAFLLAHLSGLSSRIRPGAAGPAMIMGLIFSGLFIWTGNLVAPCVASIIDFTMNYFQVRRRFSEMPPSERSA
ncbi:MAG: CPBP family intramembrane glutamic endopeptidase [Candidatus Acidiferrales bacterium]